MSGRAKIALTLSAAAGIGCLVLVAWFTWPPLKERVATWYTVITDPARVEAFMMVWGPVGAPLAFIGVQIFQVVLAPIPGEASGFAGGYLFGAAPGLVYSTIGLTVGSVINFVLGRKLGRRYVAKWMSAESLNRFDGLAKRQGAILFFIFFLFPGFPKDYLCIFLGLTGLSLKAFILMAGIGRIPGTLMLSLQGAQVFRQDYATLAVLIAISLAFAIPAYHWRERIYAWIDRSNQIRR
ncbi:MAG: VTT domain-containing protein [Deltaproteobacteria bacterium]|jgi:uncharacterized membrane protein YdjX (TVP38/TMEM64 family)